MADVVRVRLFGPARDVAGTGSDELSGECVADVLDLAAARYGEPFKQMMSVCRVWVNGTAAEDDTLVGDADEVAILPPVSGG